MMHIKVGQIIIGFGIYRQIIWQSMEERRKYNFRINHFLSKSTFYNVNIGYMTVNYNASIDGSTRPDEWWVFRDGDCESYPDSIECGPADGLFINQDLVIHYFQMLLIQL